MKRTIILSLFALIFTVFIQALLINSSTASESKINDGIVFVGSFSKLTSGVYCGTQSGSFTTDGSGGVKLMLPNGTYTICIGGSGGGTITVVVNNNVQQVWCTNGLPCTCGD